MVKRQGKGKHIPQRTCISCRQTAGKRDLVRIVRQPDGQIAIDPKGKMAGRGAYLCANRTCWRESLAKGRLGPALRTTLTPEQRALLETYAASLPEVPAQAGQPEGLETPSSHSE
ncbi:MAG: YlxR family protein [Chloroflexota bacterium]